jgi:hypothetical protein
MRTYNDSRKDKHETGIYIYVNIISKRGTNQLPLLVYADDVGGYGNVNKVKPSERWRAQQLRLIELRRKEATSTRFSRLRPYNFQA